MGMFDIVICKAKLPHPEPMDGDDFQTKCATRRLDRYTITENGDLWVEQFDGEMYQDEVRSDFHGYMSIYGTTIQTGRWKEYKCKFTDGKMVAVTDVSKDR